MALPAAATRAELVVPTADGVNALGGSAASPVFMTMGSALPLCSPIGVAGTAVTAAAETTLLPAAGLFTLPANWWVIGRTIEIYASGLISSAVTTPGTARFKVKMGSVAAFDSGAILLATVASRTDTPWTVRLRLTCRSVGASTSTQLWGSGDYVSDDLVGITTGAVADGIAQLPWNAAQALGTGFDSTIANAFDFTFTQVVTTGSITLEQFWCNLVGG